MATTAMARGRGSEGEWECVMELGDGARVETRGKKDHRFNKYEAEN
jgi:hypothetical protein